MRSVALALAAITAAALALRWPLLGDSLFSDELSTHFIVAGRDLDRVLEIIRTDQEVTPPLYFVLAWLTEGIGAVPESLRLVPLVAGVAAVPLTYALGAWTLGRRAGLAAAALIALSPFMIAYSTQARGYILAMVLALGATLSMLRGLDRGGVGWWVSYAACTAAAIYTHYTIVFLLVAQLGWALWFHRSSWRWLLGANLAAALAYLPWLPGFREDVGGLNQISRVHPFGLESMLEDLARSSIGNPGFTVGHLPGRVGTTMIVVGIAVGAAAWMLGRARRQAGWWRPSPRAVLVLVLAISTPAGLIFASAVGDDVLFPRNLVVSWPGFAVAIGAIITAARGPLRIVSVALVLGGFAIGSVKTLERQNRAPDYQAAAAVVERGSPHRAVVIDLPYGASPTSALEVALAEPGEPLPRNSRVLRLNAPSVQTQIRGQADGIAPIDLPVASPSGIVRQAARLARGGELYVVVPGSVHDPRLRRAVETSGNLTPLRALPRRFHQVEYRVVPGLLPLTVYGLRDSGSSR